MGLRSQWRTSMWLAPIPMYFFPDLDAVERFAADSSRTTHGAEECIDACRLFARIICRALLGRPKDEVILDLSVTSRNSVAQRREGPQRSQRDAESFVSGERIAAIARGAYREKSEADIRGSG